MIYPPFDPPSYSSLYFSAEATSVDNKPSWQCFAEKFTENDDFNAPARAALRAAAREEKPEEIATLLKKMHNQSNYGGTSELLDELEKNPEGPIFTALKALSAEIVKQSVNFHAPAPGHYWITHLLAKAIETNKIGAIHTICSSIPFIPDQEPCWYHPSGILMRDCLNLIIDDAEKEPITRQILNIFVETARQSKPINAAFELFSDRDSRRGPFFSKCEDLLSNQTESAHKAAAREHDLRV